MINHTQRTFLTALAIVFLGFLAGKAVTVAQSKISIDVNSAKASLSKPDQNDYVLMLKRKLATNPDYLLQLSQDDVSVVLDQPDFIFTDNPAQIWQFRGKECVIDLFFNLEPHAAKKTLVAYYETRSTDHYAHVKNVSPFATKNCLQTLFEKQSEQKSL